MNPKPTIRDEIKQQRPFRSRSAEAAIALLRTASLIHRRAEGVALAEGLSIQQYNILRILRGAKMPLPTMEIAERLIEQAPGITRLVNVLEERGLIRREQWAGDRRHVLCQITAAGLKLLDKLEGPMNTLDDDTMGNLTDDQLEQLLAMLDEIRAANRPDT
ncbi:MAG TPA: MarR family transcriptional regulator [Thermoanaerobaculia bacterium]|nr:MarR family transcriptional regulator [Thermoanaerobaculia bacterium]